MGTLYPLSTEVDPVVSLADEKNNKAALWHRRLGHLSERDEDPTFQEGVDRYN